MAVTTLHLNFRGEARAALEFYRSVFGGDLVVVPYGETAEDPAQAGLVVWGEVRSPDGPHVMAYDVQTALPFERGRNSFYASLRSPDAAEVEAAWAGLSEGASIEQPLGPSAFSPLYGKLTDRFGIVWIIDVVVPWGG